MAEDKFRKMIQEIRSGYTDANNQEEINKVVQENSSVESETLETVPGAAVPGAAVPDANGGSIGGAGIIHSLNEETEIDTLIANSSTLTEQEKRFILSKSAELLKIEQDILKIDFNIKYKIDYSKKIKPLMYRLHRNILFLYLKKREPNQIEFLNQFIEKTDNKIQKFNEIISKSFEIGNTEIVIPIDEATVKENSAKNKLMIEEINRDLGADIDPANTTILQTTLDKLVKNGEYDDATINKIGDILLKVQTDTERNSTQTAGGTISPESFSKYINILLELYKLYNSDVLVKLFALISDKTKLTDLVTSFNSLLKPPPTTPYTPIDIVDFFLFNIPDDSVAIEEKFNQEKYSKYHSRDTGIHKLYLPEDPKKYIFYLKLLSLLNVQDILSDSSLVPAITTLIIKSYINYIKLYDFYILINSNSEILKKLNTLYEELILKYKKVFAYIKIRTDAVNKEFNITGDINPRYKYKIDKTNGKNFYLKYTNIDGQFGVTKDPLDSTKVSYDKQKARAGIKAAKAAFASNKQEYLELSGKNNRDQLLIYSNLDGIFENETSSKIAEHQDFKIIIDKIKLFEDVSILGYGASGSGKTATLVYYENGKTGKSEDGILIEMCNILGRDGVFDKMELQMTNIYVWHNNKNAPDINKISPEDYKYDSIKFDEFGGSTKIDLTYDVSTKAWKKDDKKLAWIINNAFEEKREIKPTPNNPNSSRSHVLVCITFFNGGIKKCTVVICDLAGVENPFQCDNPTEIYNFDDKYKISKKFKGKPVILDSYLCDQQDKTTTPVTDQIPELTSNVTKYNKVVDEINTILSGGDGQKCLSVIKDENIHKCDNKLSLSEKYDDITDVRGHILKVEDEIKKIKDSIDIESKKFSITSELFIPFIIEKTEDELREIIFKNEPGSFSLIQEGKIDKVKTPTFNSLFKELSEQLIVRFTDLYNKYDEEKAEIDTKMSEELKTAFNTIMYEDFIVNVATKTKKNPAKKGKGKTEAEPAAKPPINIDLTLSDLLKTETKKGFKPAELEDSSVKFKKACGYLKTIAKSVQFYINYEKSNLKQKKETELLNLRCDKDRILKLQFNCQLNNVEGVFINASLRDIRNDIQKLIQSTLNNNTFYEKNFFPYCRNIKLDVDIFELFYEKPKKIYSGNAPQIIEATGKCKVSEGDQGIIFRIMESEFCVNMNKLNFVIFNVINFSENPTTNNPPNPPYININNIIYYTFIKYNITKIRKHLKILLIETSKYDFYKINKEWNDLINESIIEDKIKEDNSVESIIKFISQVTDFIKNFNAATLIGSLDSTEALQSTVSASSYDGMVCSYNLDLLNILTKINSAKLKTGYDKGDTVFTIYDNLTKD